MKVVWLAFQQLNESLKSGKIELDDAGCLMLPDVSFCPDSLKHKIRSLENIMYTCIDFYIYPDSRSWVYLHSLTGGCPNSIAR